MGKVSTNERGEGGEGARTRGVQECIYFENKNQQKKPSIAIIKILALEGCPNIALECERHGRLRSSPRLDQLEALPNDVRRRHDVNYADFLARGFLDRLPLALRVPRSPLSVAELSREGNVLLRDHAARDARAEHASHESVECGWGEVQG